MALLSPTALRSIIDAHGLRPYDLKVEFVGEQPASYFASFGSVPWQERPVKAQSLGLGYGADNFSFTFSTWDPYTVEAAHITSPISTLKIPKNGEFVVVTVFDSTTGPNGQVLFRGTTRSVHEHTADAGKSYNCEAISEVSRLNDFHVTFTVNYHNDPVNPSPRFDNSGNILAVTVLKTVYQIAQDIFNFGDAWKSIEFFQFGDIDWNGLDTDVRCGGYVPTTITFQDTPKGKAFEDLLSRAGNFTFIYVPQRNGRGKIRVVELNLACNSCGKEWTMNWPPATAAAQIAQANYAYAYVIGEDNTEWNSKESCNVVRLTSSPIRFYSGNWIIPEVIDNDNNKNAITIENDTAAAQLKRAMSLDGVNYRFTFIQDNNQDIRTHKLFPVGMPLYPDWNIHEDWLPGQLEIQNVQLPAAGAKFTADKYVGLIEFQPFTVGDEIVRGVPRVKHINNLRMYQAWYADKPCPACTPTDWPVGAPGLGLVKNVYTNAENEPSLTFEAITGAGVRRAFGPTDTVNPGERVIFTVNNYIMAPADFGASDKFGVRLKPPTGLIPLWANQTEVNAATNYPLPWKNLCPYCRGTGMQPEHKLRDIEAELFSGRNNQITQVNGVSEIPVDAEFTQTAPESWEQTQTRLSMRETAMVVVEAPLMKPQIPSYQFRNMNFPDQKKLTSDQQHFQFANPLTFVNINKRLPQFASQAANSPEMKIVPDSWTCEVPYTTVVMAPARCRIDYQLGRVIFDDPQFIPCRKQFSTYILLHDNKYLITNDILTKRGLGRGQMLADRNWNPTGFWRFARVWMTFYYCRNLHYEYMYNTPAGVAIPTTTINTKTPDGLDAQYEVRTSIHDGKLVIEARKKSPTGGEAGGFQFPTGNRVLQRAISESEARIETSFNDLYKMPMPTLVGASASEIETYKRTTQHLDFPRARILKIETTTPGEQQAEMEGYTAADHATAITRPKVFSWAMRDNRSLLLARVIRELEIGNNLIVSGNMRLVGVSNDFSQGLGFVNKPDKGKAAIKRVEFNFTAAMQAEIDVSREEARMGEIVPKAEDRMHNLEKGFVQQQRTTDFLRAAQNGQQNTPTDTRLDDVMTGSIGIYRGGS